MSRQPHTRSGFTLVELLTVIAIIGILSSFVIVGLSRMRTKADVTDVQQSLRQMENLLVAYYTDNNTYPPAYGMLDRKALEELEDDPDLPMGTEVTDLEMTEPDEADYFVSTHYMAELGVWGNPELYDPFGFESTDSDSDGRTSILEYMPDMNVAILSNRDGRDESTEDYTDTVYGEQRTFIYAPVNLRQFRKFKEYWDDGRRNQGEPSEDMSEYYGYPDYWDPTDPGFPNFRFPPSRYDAFVLISAGPLSNTRGIVYGIGDGTDDRIPPESDGGPDEAYRAHIAALATYYMATRDLKGGPGGQPDGIPDFDYTERQSGEQGTIPFPFDQFDIDGNVPRVDAAGRTYAKRGLGIDGPIYRVTQ